MAAVDIDKLMSDTMKTLDSVTTFLDEWDELEDDEKGSVDARLPIVMSIWKQSVQLETLCCTLQLLIKSEKKGEDEDGDDDDKTCEKESGDVKPTKKKSKKKCCHLHSDETK